jgi:hypothetical protein
MYCASSGAIIGGELGEGRLERFAATFARALTQSWGIPFLRKLVWLRPLHLPTRFRYFLHRHICSELHSRLADTWRTTRCAAPRRLDVRAALLVSAAASDQGMSDLGWRPHLRNAAKIVAVGGNHHTLFEEPQLSTLSQRFAEIIEDAARGAAVPVQLSTDPIACELSEYGVHPIDFR